MAMNSVVFGVLGAIAGLGAMLIAAGVTGTSEPASQPRVSRRLIVERINSRIGFAMIGAAIGYALTGWIASGLLLGYAGWSAPTLAGARARRTAVTERTEAIAVWAEQLRDTMRAAAGMQEAIATTALVAPAPIRSEVTELAARLRREPFRTAMAHFATQLADPTADKIAAALVLASERRAANLAGVLSEVAAAARQQATMQLRVEASRARVYAQTMVVCAITAAVIGMLLLLNRSYLDAYNNAVGQLVLVGIGALFAGCGVGVAQLGRVNQAPRILNVSRDAS
jgi:tight adherence protein B